MMVMWCALYTQAAKAGAAGTTALRARAGRASYVHYSQLTQPDPGAVAVAIWLEAVLTALSNYLDSL